MEELNVMRRILRQNNLSYTSQKKFSDGHYRFEVEESDRFPLGQAYIIDIDAFPVASEFLTPVYIKKDSEEVDETEQHYALVNTIEHILLENESKQLLQSSYSDYLGVLPLKEYKALIEEKAEQIMASAGEGEKA